VGYGAQITVAGVVGVTECRANRWNGGAQNSPAAHEIRHSRGLAHRLLHFICSWLRPTILSPALSAPPCPQPRPSPKEPPQVAKPAHKTARHSPAARSSLRSNGYERNTAHVRPVRIAGWALMALGIALTFLALSFNSSGSEAAMWGLLIISVLVFFGGFVMHWLDRTEASVATAEAERPKRRDQIKKKKRSRRDAGVDSELSILEPLDDLADPVEPPLMPELPGHGLAQRHSRFGDLAAVGSGSGSGPSLGAAPPYSPFVNPQAAPSLVQTPVPTLRPAPRPGSVAPVHAQTHSGSLGEPALQHATDSDWAAAWARLPAQEEARGQVASPPGPTARPTAQPEPAANLAANPAASAPVFGRPQALPTVAPQAPADRGRPPPRAVIEVVHLKNEYLPSENARSISAQPTASGRPGFANSRFAATAGPAPSVLSVPPGPFGAPAANGLASAALANLPAARAVPVQLDVRDELAANDWDDADADAGTDLDALNDLDDLQDLQPPVWAPPQPARWAKGVLAANGAGQMPFQEPFQAPQQAPLQTPMQAPMQAPLQATRPAFAGSRHFPQHAAQHAPHAEPSFDDELGASDLDASELEHDDNGPPPSLRRPGLLAGWSHRLRDKRSSHSDDDFDDEPGDPAASGATSAAYGAPNDLDEPDPRWLPASSLNPASLPARLPASSPALSARPPTPAAAVPTQPAAAPRFATSSLPGYADKPLQGVAQRAQAAQQPPPRAPAGFYGQAPAAEPAGTPPRRNRFAQAEPLGPPAPPGPVEPLVAVVRRSVPQFGQPAQHAAMPQAWDSSFDDRAQHAPLLPAGFSLSLLQAIDWRSFEAVVDALFRQAGFRSRILSLSPDGGADIGLYSRHRPEVPASVLQCVHGPLQVVGVGRVRALARVMAEHHADRGQLVCNGSFHPQAEGYARDNCIRLLDGPGLLAQVQRGTPEQQQALLVLAHQGLIQ
jgi:Restriction endonuclease